MRITITAFSAAIIGLAACASAPAPQIVELADLPVQEGDAGLLGDLLRREDLRQYDSTAFHGFLHSDAEIVRSFAVRALGRIGDQAAVGPLLHALRDPSLRVRTEAAFALGELGDSSATVIDSLSRLLSSASPDGVEAVAALGKLRSDSARARLERLLQSGADASLSGEALLALVRYPRRPTTTEVAAPYLMHDNAELRWRAAYLMTRSFADPALVPQLIEVARNDSGLVASYAVRGLRAATADSAGRRADALAAVLTRIDDPNPMVRINAIVATAGYRDSTLSTRITPLLTHRDPNTRVTAAQALGVLRGSHAAGALEAIARSVAERPVVRGAALSALMAISPDRALPLATELGASAAWLDRLYAVRAVSAAPSQQGFPLLRNWSSDRDPRVAVAAVEALAGARDTLPQARALFIERLAASDPFVRAAALTGLQRSIEPADQILLFDAYARALRDSVPEAAVAALESIARLAQSNPAVDRSFRIRFPAAADCPHADIRAGLRRHFQMADNCGVQPVARVYERTVRELVIRALREGNPRARITTAGTVVDIELLPVDAPLTVRNFMTLAERGYFDGGRWHRVVPNFVLQDGDPYGNGSGGPGYAIRDEMNRVRYLTGTVGMALSGPDTGGSQFFITHSPQPHLDGGYTVFGRVVNMTPAVYHIAQDDVIERIEILW